MGDRGGVDVDVAIVGAGFAGLYMLHRARGLGLSARVFEAGSDLGGTWFWNRYPGARCDIESVEYSYSFDPDLEQEWQWSERYAAQPEILRYLNHVADRFDLRGGITFDTRVTAAHFDDRAAIWRVATDRDQSLTARFVVMATGCLSSTNTPSFSGIDDFTGQLLHTGQWPHEPVELTGKRVAVIGTGSSAIQSIPIIAEQAQHLTVFQRTPNYAVPAHNGPIDPEMVAQVKADYSAFREANRRMVGAYGARFGRNDVSVQAVSDDERAAELERRWQHGGLPFLGGFNDILLNQDSNTIVAEFVRDKVRSMVDDPDMAEMLTPTTTIGCKRLCVDTGYYATFNRPNVELVDLNVEPIERFTSTGIVAGGVERQFDTIVLATGFDAMTGTLMKIDIRGRRGLTLRDKWEAGPRTYLGLQISGFPNLFLVTGPGSPSVLSNMVVSIEHHVDWISECLAHLESAEIGVIEATIEAEDQWVDHVNLVASFTLFPTCNSWYLGANVPGKQRVFMPLPGFPNYIDQVREIVADDYRGFAIS
jgi:cyclohexanone monooxygenase